ncbi:hypothetical protein TTHERM_00151690 (macronuclear) [Tetrahymena thermophila SB210]|uniref:Uncharacterized protein n=1 Tax=Tetrahymena thermophila (strain SB210) TaxID=312017 RepID=I7M2X0_TETTS|nr:hypothetical protein TTHERM_00151690 [Tetrahymena thermophila SB210]EAS01456.2 hypothetical protein TTHERM_00151690 [Tetrahymena thermophila SB210]|eukprot:XP_001021702.2 hypothetical protein TTHERM_00151690 [Tetrahymena thermophila SB210]
MQRALRSQTVDVQALQRQIYLSEQDYFSKGQEFNDSPLKNSNKNSQQPLQNNKINSNKQNGSNKYFESKANPKIMGNNELRLSIRNLLKIVDSSNKEKEQTKQQANPLNDYIKNVITQHNQTYKYYSSDINHSHNYINYSQKKKKLKPQYQSFLANKGSEFEYLPYQPQVTPNYWAGISKNTTGKSNTAIAPYVFKINNQKIDESQQKSTSRLSSSRSTSRKNSYAPTDTIQNGQTIDFEMNPSFELQSTIFIAKDQANALKKSNEDIVNKSQCSRNSVGGETKNFQLPFKRASLQFKQKEKRVQSARVHKPSNNLKEQNKSQVSIDCNHLYYSSIFQESNYNQESKDFTSSKDSNQTLQKPKQLDLNNAVNMPVEDEIFSSRSNFMRGNTLKNNWMSRLQQQIKDKNEQKQNSQKNQNKSNYFIVEVQQPQTPQKADQFCLTNEFIKKQAKGLPFQMINSFFMENDNNNIQKSKQIKRVSVSKSNKKNKLQNQHDENHVSITSIQFYDNFKDGYKNGITKPKQISHQSTPTRKKLDVKTPLNFNNWRK